MPFSQVRTKDFFHTSQTSPIENKLFSSNASIKHRTSVHHVLLMYARLEGHIAETTLQASLFQKLSSLYIIQVFFVQLISGSVFAELQKITDDPTSIISLLATSLPAQSASFMQFVLVDTFLAFGIEILRIIPIILAFIRKRVGPNLTEKERQTPYFFDVLRPIDVPEDFDFTLIQADLILYYVILFVFGILSPVSCFVMAFVFFMLMILYRNQFVYIYDTTSYDTGGQLWTRFVRLALTSMIIGEFTLFGALSLKKGAMAAPLLIPLVVGTFMFSMYISQEHYQVTDNLPSTDCMAKDDENMVEEGLDLEFVRGKYLQPSLQTRVLMPDNYHEDHHHKEAERFCEEPLN